MKKRLAMLLILCMIMSLMAGCGGIKAEEEQAGAQIYVFAAASLTDCLNEIITLYQEESRNSVIPVYEGSGALKKQIAEGADCDIFISANQTHMDALEEAGEVNAETRKDLLSV